MSNEELKLKLSVIISATNTSGNQKLDAIMELFNQLHPSPTPAVEDVLADIISIRNKLYEDLPTGEMNAFELLQTIKWHINELDNYCTTLSTYKSLPSTPVQDGWVRVTERLPNESDADENGKVLIYRNTNEGQKGLSKSIFDYFMVKNCDSDTHWQPLPEPPKNKL